MSKYIQGETFFVVLMMAALAYVYFLLYEAKDMTKLELKVYYLPQPSAQ